ncbi:serine/threonine protein kinase, CMGC, dual-specificity [Rhizoclosmatium sp. JEL0117]|nr:serine/threonine protein kinase, CMGC, dual-specificity [Rhizoclosmatium sp. JEL0117]
METTTPQVLGGVSVAVIAAAALFTLSSKSGNSKRPPSLPNWPLIGHLPYFAKHLFNGTFYVYLRQVQLKLGHITTNNLVGKIEYHVSDPDTCKRIATSPEFVRTDFLLRPNQDVFGFALFGMENGPLWKKHRKAIVSGMGPQFVRKAYTVTVELMDDMIRMFNAHIDTSPSKSYELNIREYLSLITLDVITRVAFTHDMNCLQTYDDDRRLGREESASGNGNLRKNIDEVSRVGVTRLLIPSFLWWFFKATKRHIAPQNKFFDDMIMGFLAPRRKAVEEGTDGEEGINDLLTVLLGRGDDGEMLFSDKEIRDECLAIMFAGHDTTSNTITNVFLQLCKNPHALAAMRTEIDDLTSPNDETCPAFNDLTKFVYVDYVIKETQRTMPIIMGIDREVAADEIEVLGYKFKKGDYFMANNRAILLDPEIWGPDSEEFKPERWINHQVVDGTFYPFSAGPHACPGMKMALMEAKVVLIQLVRFFDFELVDGQKLELVDGVVNHLPEGLKLRVTKRGSENSREWVTAA